MDAKQKGRAARYAAEWLGRLRQDERWLIRETGLDPGTISDFLNGERWPRTDTRNKIEDALGIGRGTLKSAAEGWLDTEPEGDPVEVAIESSTQLSRAQKLRLRAAYVDMLEADGRSGARGA
jgi:transcriptional regulator with XRE-family HTH domain